MLLKFVENTKKAIQPFEISSKELRETLLLCPKSAAKDHFGLRILSLDAGHIEATLLGGVEAPRFLKTRNRYLMILLIVALHNVNLRNRLQIMEGRA